MAGLRSGGLDRLWKEVTSGPRTVFVDLKVPDIGNTVASVVGDLADDPAVRFLTLHESLQGRHIAAAKAARGGRETPYLLTVPFVSSLDADDLAAIAPADAARGMTLDEWILGRAEAAIAHGCDGAARLDRQPRHRVRRRHRALPRALAEGGDAARMDRQPGHPARRVGDGRPQAQHHSGRRRRRRGRLSRGRPPDPERAAPGRDRRRHRAGDRRRARRSVTAERGDSGRPHPLVAVGSRHGRYRLDSRGSSHRDPGRDRHLLSEPP